MELEGASLPFMLWKTKAKLSILCYFQFSESPHTINCRPILSIPIYISIFVSCETNLSVGLRSRSRVWWESVGRLGKWLWYLAGDGPRPYHFGSKWQTIIQSFLGHSPSASCGPWSCQPSLADFLGSIGIIPASTPVWRILQVCVDAACLAEHVIRQLHVVCPSQLHVAASASSCVCVTLVEVSISTSLIGSSLGMDTPCLERVVSPVNSARKSTSLLASSVCLVEYQEKESVGVKIFVTSPIARSFKRIQISLRLS